MGMAKELVASIDSYAARAGARVWFDNNVAINDATKVAAHGPRLMYGWS